MRKDLRPNREADRDADPRWRGVGAYQGALEAVLAILIAMGIGLWADEHFGTTPRFLIVGAVVGFAAFVLRLLRMRETLESPEDSADRGADRNSNGHNAEAEHRDDEPRPFGWLGEDDQDDG